MHYGMTPRWPTLFLLGLLFLRALVPAGFMLAPVEGHLAFVLCALDEPPAARAANAMSSTAMPGAAMPGAAMPGAAMPSGHHHHHSLLAQDHPAHQHGTHVDPTCPYAQSAGPAPLPTLPAVAGNTAFERPRLPAAISQTLLQFGPLRQPSSRGPPRLV
jgi:hypothetical protein